jgi:hypothetical protein
MRRRELMLLLGGAMTAARTLRAQQQAMPVIGFLSVTSPGPLAPFTAAFRQGLSETGYIATQRRVIRARSRLANPRSLRTTWTLPEATDKKPGRRFQNHLKRRPNALTPGPHNPLVPGSGLKGTRCEPSPTPRPRFGSEIGSRIPWAGPRPAEGYAGCRFLLDPRLAGPVFVLCGNQLRLDLVEMPDFGAGGRQIAGARGAERTGEIGDRLRRGELAVAHRQLRRLPPLAAVEVALALLTAALLLVISGSFVQITALLVGAVGGALLCRNCPG